MKSKLRLLLCGLAVGILLLSGCAGGNQASSDAQIKELDKQVSSLTEENRIMEEKLKSLEAAQANQTSVLATAMTVVQLLKDQDMAGIMPYVHPVKGVRFSPYSYVDTTSNLVFTSAQVGNLMSDPTVYNWGSYDGSGDPIQLDFAAYYAKFVYDQDFVNPHIIGNNTVIGKGNMINNTATAYPGAAFVEYHFTGFDPQYSGMDWKSLRLVFENVGGNWLLIGIIHDGWTI